MTSKLPGRAEVRTFTLEEATRALPLIRAIVQDITEKYRRTCELREKLSERPGDTELEDQVENLTGDLQEHIDELDRLGVELKSVQMGLVDFYSLQDGRLVYLCWKLGEEKVQWWHSLEDGFAARQPLSL